VNKSYRWAVPAIVFSLAILGSLAQAQGQAPAGARVALLDVGRIFKNHQRFKGMMEDMKADVERAEANVKAQKEAITKKVERLQELNKGTPDYKALEEELTKNQADLQVMVTLQKNEFLQKEAKIYHSVYNEILQATDYFCKQNRVDIVLKFNNDKVDAERPDSVLTWINKPVVWYATDLDITDAILQDLNRQAPPVSKDARRPAVPFNNGNGNGNGLR
jgi:outer membrane protein